mgnify:CR=1 FL=1
MELVLTKENEDGSADYAITISPLEIQDIVRFGLIEMLKRVIEEGKQYEPTSEANVGDTQWGGLSSSDGTGKQSSKPEQSRHSSKAA